MPTINGKVILLLCRCLRRLLRPLPIKMRAWKRKLCLATVLLVLLALTRMASTSAASSQSKLGPPVRQPHQQPLQQHQQQLLPLRLNATNKGDKLRRLRQPQPQPQRTPQTSASAPSAAVEASGQVEEFLRRISEASQNEDSMAALRAKLPLLNRIAELDQSLMERAKSCGAGQQRPFAIRHVQNFAYIHNEPDICTGQLLLIAAVHSNAKYFNRRATIRRTWGSLRYVGSNRLQLVFFLGTQDSQQLQEAIDAESTRYRDIVQLDFRENYRNMSLKHLSIYEWVLAHCRSAQFLLKVDDDTFTDVVHLVAFLQHSPPDGFYCSNTKGAKPQRLKRGPKAKWAVSRAEFRGTRYPAYCEGFGYVLRITHLPDLYVCSLFQPFFWIDDVYVTGVLSAAAKVPITGFWSGHSYTGQLPSLASERILDYIFLVADHNEFLEIVWNRLWRSVLQFSLDLTL